MQLDESGNIHSYQFVKSVIRSRVKGVYKKLTLCWTAPMTRLW